MTFSKPKFWDKDKISIFSILLYPITIILKLINFSKRIFIKSNKISIPIICVGNIYLGGTGKTPLCIEIFSILKSLNMHPAFIRKKYETYQDEFNLEKKIGPAYQNKNRLNAIKDAILDKVDVAILDDGFQDLSIKKNLSIVCFNEKQWIGNGQMIPSGPLREELSALKRANCVFINGKKNVDIENKIYNKNEKIKIYYSSYIPKNLDKFINKKIIAFAGIGNANNFFDLLKENNINLIEEKDFPDHYNYSEAELKNLKDRAEKVNAILLTTEKDYLRINDYNRSGINFLKIDVKINNKNQFIEDIKKII